MKNFKIAGIQADFAVGEKKLNLVKALECIDSAAQKGAKIVCLPELFLGGYALEYARDHSDPLENEYTSQLSKKAAETDIHVICGIPRTAAGKSYNTAVIFDDHGEAIGTYDKMHLFSMDKEQNEGNFFERGEENFAVYDLGFCKLGLMICYDLRFPELARKLALNGANLIITIAAWPKKRLHQFRTLGASRAIENQCFVFAVNRTGTDEGIEFGGNTTLYDPLGIPVAGSVTDDKEQIVVTEVDLEQVSLVRTALKCFEDRLSNYGL